MLQVLLQKLELNVTSYWKTIVLHLPVLVPLTFHSIATVLYRSTFVDTGIASRNHI